MVNDWLVIHKNSYWIKIVFLIILTSIISILMGGWNFTLPGLQFDEVNHAAFAPGVMDANAARLHTFRLPDNYIDSKDGLYQYPILGGSFYNSVITTYMGLPFYETFGFSFAGLRYFHGVIGFLSVLLGSLLVARVVGFLPAYFFAVVVMSNPDFVFSLRSQGAILWPVVLFALGSIHLLLWVPSDLHVRGRSLLVFFSGVCLGLSVMSYFVGAFIVLPILVSAWYYLRKNKRDYIVLLFGLLVGYLPVIYAVVSVFWVNPTLLNRCGLPQFAIENNLHTFSQDNVHRTLLLFIKGFGDFPFTKGVTGTFRVSCVYLRFFFFIAIVIGGIFEIMRRKCSFSQIILFVIICGTFATYLLGAFFLKSLSFHHLLPLFFFLVIQLAVLISINGYTKYLFIPLGIILLVSNVNTLILAHGSLVRTGGYGYHNEMYQQCDNILSSECDDCFPIFISWGVHLQYLFLTNGQKKFAFIPGITPKEIRDLLVKHGKIALIGSVKDISDVEFSDYGIIDYHSVELRQRDGVGLYKIIMLKISNDKPKKMIKRDTAS